MSHDASELEKVFQACFLESYQTRLEGGAEEPVYLPSLDSPRDEDSTPHRILYREDYFASALHEVAHWCLAGRRRRLLEDYGYWYAEDGRSALEQVEFERVEARPQALEWILSDICQFPFNLSADNLENGTGPSESFARAVEAERARFLAEGLPSRAEIFRSALSSCSR